MIVPPVPSPAIKCVTSPRVCFQNFRSGSLHVGQTVGVIEILIAEERPRGISHISGSPTKCGIGIVHISGGRALGEFSIIQAQNFTLFFGALLADKKNDFYIPSIYTAWQVRLPYCRCSPQLRYHPDGADRLFQHTVSCTEPDDPWMTYRG